MKASLRISIKEYQVIPLFLHNLKLEAQDFSVAHGQSVEHAFFIQSESISVSVFTRLVAAGQHLVVVFSFKPAQHGRLFTDRADLAGYGLTAHDVCEPCAVRCERGRNEHPPISPDLDTIQDHRI